MGFEEALWMRPEYAARAFSVANKDTNYTLNSVSPILSLSSYLELEFSIASLLQNDHYINHTLCI